jgi:MarR family transcriptional regulator for hemolysin
MDNHPAIATQGLGFLIAETNRLMRKEFDRRVEALGLTRAQWLFIAYLSRQAGCTQNDLADSLQLHKIAVSRQADRLVRAGWVRRIDCVADGRANRLFLTAKAKRMRLRMAEVGAHLRLDYLRGLSKSRQARLIEDLTRIRATLQGMENAATG